VSLPALTEERINVVLLDSVIHPDSYWLQAGLSGSFYDANDEVLGGRLSAGLQLGKRLKNYGFFGSVEFDRNYDFTLDTEKLNVLNVGMGGEYLSFLGHTRSSITLGFSILLSDTDIDEKGEVGWFIDLRPASLRWGMGKKSVLELTPLSLDIIAPVTTGIPLVVVSYMTVLSYEWSH